MITTFGNDTYWIQAIPGNGSFDGNGYWINRAYPNPRPWIDPWWTQVSGPFASESAALAALTDVAA